MLLKLKKLSSFGQLPAILDWTQKHGFHFLLCFLLIYLLVQKDVTLSISFNNTFTPATATTTEFIATESTSPKQFIATPKKVAAKPLTAMQQKQLAYVHRFAKVAKSEMHKFGVPASIKLAQGLLESQAGKSALAVKNNNHFGIKCFSRNCKKGHCSNFSDDSHKDFFRIFETTWESYRAHSELLQNKRYRHLAGSDYKDWAYGLVKAGYATDPKYGDKLINLIETLELYEYDS